MQRHAQIAFDLVKDIPFLADATDVVLMHHERFLNIREDVWPTIASNQRRIAGLSSELRRNPSMLRIGLGLLPD